MALWRPDQSFYPSPRMAMRAPAETLAYVALINPRPTSTPDAIAVVDVAPGSPTYAQVVGRIDMPNAGDELHHFGWNACSSCLCPYAPHPHMERRYLVVPGLRSSRIHIIDTKPDPRRPTMARVIEPQKLIERAGYSRPHTTHCGPDGIYMNAIGSADGDGPGGVFILDPETFDVRGRWELERGPQYLAYDFWWHLGHDTMITSEWGTPKMVESGVNPELLLSGQYGHALHVWDLRRRRHRQTLDLGAEYQMVLELRPAHDPTEAYGFVGVVTSLKDLSSSIWLWHHEGTNGNAWSIRKVIEIPAEPADPDDLPPLLKGFKAVPPLVTDINLSLDDRFLYVSCWGTGELRQYDVTDPMSPQLTGSITLGGMVNRTAHPSDPKARLNGGPQMVEISRDGRRVYLTNSLYAAWDEQFYPDGIRGWMAKADADPSGGLRVDPAFFLQTGETMRPHQVHLEGGDASSDSYCYA
jgi:selenium-binding protein 1